MSTSAKWKRNILACYESADLSTREQGLNWYRDAHYIAASLGKPVRVGAAVIAALSPRKTWEHNVALARAVADGSKVVGQIKSCVSKARKIWGGCDPERILRGPKELAFWQSICRKGRSMCVCVDRHAYSLAEGRSLNNNELSLTKKRYQALSRAYADVAVSVGLWPAELQAITWVQWRKTKGLK